MSIKTKKITGADYATQRYLPFSQIRENVLLMKDNSGRIVMQCKPINFLLKSTDEQDAIIMSFQRFLNALSFPVQIIVRSTKLDIDSYLANLEDKAINQKNSLLQNQTYEYIAYLKKLIEVAQIMKKDFYIIIPFDEVEDASVKDTSFFAAFKNFWSSISGGNDIVKIKGQIRNFNVIKKGLFNRQQQVASSLESIGIKSQVLKKEELIKYMTNYYNPNMRDISNVKGDIKKINLIDINN